MKIVKFISVWQNNLTLFSRLLIGFGLVLSFALIITLINLFQLQSLGTNFNQLEKVDARVKLTNNIRLTTVAQVAGTLDQLWSGRPSSQLANFDLTVSNYLNGLRSLEPDASLQVEIGKLKDQIAEFNKFLVKTVELENQGKSLEARASWINGSILFRDLSDEIEKIGKTQEDLLATTRRSVIQDRDQTVIVTLVCSGLALLVALGLALLITKSIVGRVEVIRKAMQLIADEAGLQMSNIPVSGQDELAVMAQAFNRMILKLKTAVEALDRTGQTVSNSSDYFTRMMRRQLVVAEQESSAVSDIVGAASQLKTSAQQIDQQVEFMLDKASNNLNNVNTLVQAVFTASDQVTKTHEATQTVISGISRMRDETQHVNKEVQDLLEQLSAIRKLAVGLKEIAGETHLLSLNAAIESAGAGQYGERFSVIALSVKTLADQSQNLVAGMSVFIQGIEAKVENVKTALHQTDLELSRSRQLIELIERIGQENFQLSGSMSQTITKISHLVDETVSQAHTIAVSTREQHKATEDIIATIRAVETVVKDSMQQHNNSVEAVTTLQSEVNQLNKLVYTLNTVVVAA